MEGRGHRNGTTPHGSPEVVFRVKLTFILTNRLANFIVGEGLVEEAMKGTLGKAETHRLGYENSEDALTFNVFRSLQEAGSLGRVAELATGEPAPGEPDLFLWGRQVHPDGTAERWKELQEIRDRVEPTHRQQTEPDVCLHVSGWGWIFIEGEVRSRDQACSDREEAKGVGEALRSTRTAASRPKTSGRG